MKTNKKIIFSIALIILIIFALTSNIFALSDVNYYDPGNTTVSQDNTKFYERAGKVLGFIQYIGIAVSILALAIIGIKYLLSSVEGKAEYKKTMVPYIVGCFLLMGTSLVVGLISGVAGV